MKEYHANKLLYSYCELTKDVIFSWKKKKMLERSGIGSRCVCICFSLHTNRKKCKRRNIWGTTLGNIRCNLYYRLSVVKNKDLNIIVTQFLIQVPLFDLFYPLIVQSLVTHKPTYISPAKISYYRSMFCSQVVTVHSENLQS